MPDLEGLLLKTGVLIRKPAKKPEDVAGFDYIIRRGDTCWKYYAANPPLHGMTRPEEIECPLGIQLIGDYKVDYKQAIALFLETRCGGAFTGISLSWPLVPSVTEPQWYIHSITGQVFIVGAGGGDKGRCLGP